MNKNNHKGITRIRENFKLWSLYLTSLSLSIKLKNNNPNDVCGQTLHQVLNGDKLRDKWLKLLMMYSYSSPYQFTSDFPAELALYNLQNYMLAGWYRIKGGVYSYVEAILKAFQGKIHLNSQINRVEREIKQVKLITQGGECLVFDKVVFATPPDQILKLLAKPTKEEQTFLTPWQANQVVTSIHEDPSMYKPFKINSPSEFDFFETETGWGYNAILNQVCGIPDQNPYFLSYNLDDRIDPDKVISRQKHHTPFYSVEAMKHRSNLIKANGQKNTCFAGAWLHDGLHEGATVSAKRVAELITR
jgi:predicted NAD/FAD-binding protein